MAHQINVRQARLSDLGILAALEQKAWERRETEILSELSLKKWYEEDSPFFLVAETELGLCGYYFARQLEFNPTDADRFFEQFSTEDEHPSNTAGKSAFAQCVIAITPGAGLALHARIHEIFKEVGTEYFVGFSRMPMFNRFANRVEQDQNNNDISLRDLALWYAHESTERLGMECWPECSAKPLLSLPSLRRADPVIAFHGRAISMSLLRVMPDYMQDPESRNFGALLASKIQN